MPRHSQALSVCTTPGCPTLTPGGRCPDCTSAASRQRGSARAKGYDARWERTREAYLRAHPYCGCDECLTLPSIMRPWATEVDHIDGLGPNGPRGHDWGNLQALTKSHHSRKTGRETGFGNRNR